MARIVVNPALPEAKLLLAVTDKVQRVRAELARVNNIMDFTRAGPNFTGLGAALGCTALEAETLYSRYRAIEAAMNGVDFVALSEVDQG